MYNHAEYLSLLYNRERTAQILDRMDILARELKVESFAVTGISGAVFGGALSLYTGIPLTIVRKDNDNSHSMNRIEFPDSLSENSIIVFVDDLIYSGKSLLNVTKSLALSGRKISFSFTYLSCPNYYVMREKGVSFNFINYCFCGFHRETIDQSLG